MPLKLNDCVRQYRKRTIQRQSSDVWSKDVLGTLLIISNCYWWQLDGLDDAWSLCHRARASKCDHILTGKCPEVVRVTSHCVIIDYLAKKPTIYIMFNRRTYSSETPTVTALSLSLSLMHNSRAKHFIRHDYLLTILNLFSISCVFDSNNMCFLFKLLFCH